MLRESQHRHFEDKIQEQVRLRGFPPTCASLGLRLQTITQLPIDLLFEWGWCESTRMGGMDLTSLSSPRFISVAPNMGKGYYAGSIYALFLSVISLCLDKTKILQIYKVLKVSKISFEVWNQASKPPFRISWDCVWHLDSMPFFICS